MLHNREFTIQGWTAQGPAFTVAKPASGWRNRKARRAGERFEQQHGPHELLGGEEELAQDVPAAAMLVGASTYEIWAFKGGHVYAVDVLIDGDASRLVFDASEEDAFEILHEDMQLLECRALEGEDLKAAFAGTLEQPTNYSDGSESQQPIADVSGSDSTPVAADDQPEAELAPADAPPADAETPAASEAPEAELEHEASAPAADDSAYGEPAGEAAEPEGNEGDVEGEAHASSIDPSGDSVSSDDTDGEEPSTGEHDYDGRVVDFEADVANISDDELLRLSEEDSRVGVRDAASHELERRTSSES